jgi:hypothetical protein
MWVFQAKARDSGFFSEPPRQARREFWASHVITAYARWMEAPWRARVYRSPRPSTFTAPTPWIFGGAARGSVGDGYYIFLTPLSLGEHTLRFGGIFRFTLE